jgi:hypothetical protein
MYWLVEQPFLRLREQRLDRSRETVEQVVLAEPAV